MVSYTLQLKHTKNQKAATDCRMVMDAVCTHFTSQAVSRYIAVKLTTDSYQFWVAH